MLGDLRELVQELEPIKEWFTLGLYLGLKDDELREIEADHCHLLRRKSEVLSRWLRKGHSCTWRRVVEVLMQMGEMVVADIIRLKYLVLTTGRRWLSLPSPNCFSCYYNCTNAYASTLGRIEKHEIEN